MGLTLLNSWELGMLGLALVGALISGVAAWRGLIWPRIAVASTLLGVGAALLGGWFAGFWPFTFGAFRDPRHVGFLLLVTAVTAVALPFRRLGARWVGLGLGAAGLLSSGLNSIGALYYQNKATVWGASVTWLFITGTLWSAVIGFSLLGPRMRETFLARSDADGLWRSSHRLVRSVRWTILTNLVAVPMLLVYAWVQPIVPSTRLTALVLAVVLGLGTALAMGRKVVGALLLSVGGLGLLVQTLATLSLGGRAQLYITSYYTVFWLPAALASLVCAALLARPLRDHLRQR